MTSGLFRISLEIASDIRVLTFEDADYRGSGNMLGRKDWSSLIDSPQYNGPLLYPNSEENVYNWHDEGNTELASRLVNAYGDGNFWTGGMAVSRLCRHRPRQRRLQSPACRFLPATATATADTTVPETSASRMGIKTPTRRGLATTTSCRNSTSTTARPVW